MKGQISIKEFIERVKQELVEAQDKSGTPFYELTEVTLEISFAVNASAKTGFNLYVVEMGGSAKAEQTHKVSLKLTPLPVEGRQHQSEEPGKEADEASATPTAPADAAQAPAKQKKQGGGGGGGGGGMGMHVRGRWVGPKYSPR